MEFASPVGMFYTDSDSLTVDVFNKIIEIANDPTEDTFKFKTQSQTTPDDLHIRPFFNNLVNHIDTHVERFVQEVLGIKKDDIDMTAMWSNIHQPGSKHHYHQHPNAFLSGAYYPLIPRCEDPGNIVFVDPRQAKNMVYADFVKPSCISNRNIWVTPKTGLLVLFPSWLEHGTDPFLAQSHERRVSISFNYELNKCSSKTMRISR